MTHVGEGRGAEHLAYASAPPAGSPVGGEILADRYQLEQHVNTDSSGRQIWRGVDVVLRRQVAIIIRYPGGEAAAQMLQTAVEASRIVHPNLAGVYDAIDENERAYVVREWVDGSSLRDHITVGLFDGERAIAVAHATSAAVTAVHSTGMTHGNIHPGTVLIGMDGRVVLADARADGAVPGEEDVRAIGGLLYFVLTGYWPHAEVAGPRALPDAVRDPAGGLAAPRQVRAGVPDFLDNLTMDLLDRRLAVPPAEVLAGEFARLDTDPDEAAPASYHQAGAYYGEQGYTEPGYAQPAAEPVSEPVSGTGPLRLSADPQRTTPKPSGRKIAVGLAVLLVVGMVGLLVGLNFLTGSPSDSDEGTGAAAGTEQAPATGDPSPTSPEIGPFELGADQVRIVDPEGTRGELEGAANVVDGDLGTSWRSHTYFDGLQVVKSGIGILVDLGEERHVTTVRVEVGSAGATAEIRTGDADPGASEAGDQEIYENYQPVGNPIEDAGTTMLFDGFDSDTTYRYLLVWFTDLPAVADGDRIEVQQVAVEGY